MFQNNKKIITSILLITLALIAIFISGIFYYILQGTSNLGEYIENDLVYVENKTKFQAYTYPFQIDNSLPNKIVELKDNWSRPLKPIVTLVFNGYPDNEPYQRIWVFELERENIFSNKYKISRRQGAIISNLTFQEVADLTSKYDITTDFSGKSNYKITSYSPLTPEEIETSMRRRENEEANRIYNENFMKLDDSKKYDACIEKTNGYEDLIEAVKRGDKTFKGIFGTLDITDPEIYNEVSLRKEQQESIKDCEVYKQ